MARPCSCTLMQSVAVCIPPRSLRRRSLLSRSYISCATGKRARIFFELSITNMDKPAISQQELRDRASQFIGKYLFIRSLSLPGEGGCTGENVAWHSVSCVKMSHVPVTLHPRRQGLACAIRRYLEIQGKGGARGGGGGLKNKARVREGEYRTTHPISPQDTDILHGPVQIFIFTQGPFRHSCSIDIRHNYTNVPRPRAPYLRPC